MSYCEKCGWFLKPKYCPDCGNTKLSEDRPEASGPDCAEAFLALRNYLKGSEHSEYQLGAFAVYTKLLVAVMEAAHELIGVRQSDGEYLTHSQAVAKVLRRILTCEVL